MDVESGGGVMEKTIEILLKEHGERIAQAIVSHYEPATNGDRGIDGLNLKLFVLDLAHLARTTK
jgi:hypothetical protein